MQEKATPKTLLKGASKLPSGSLSSSDSVLGKSGDTKDAIKGFLTASDGPPIGPPPMGGGFNYSMQQSQIHAKPVQSSPTLAMANQPKIFNPAAAMKVSVTEVDDTQGKSHTMGNDDVNSVSTNSDLMAGITAQEKALSPNTQSPPEMTSLGIPVVTGAPIPANTSSFGMHSSNISSGGSGGSNDNNGPSTGNSVSTSSSSSSRSSRKQTSAKKVDIPYDKVLNALTLSPCSDTKDGKAFFPEVSTNNDNSKLSGYVSTLDETCNRLDKANPSEREVNSEVHPLLASASIKGQSSPLSHAGTASAVGLAEANSQAVKSKSVASQVMTSASSTSASTAAASSQMPNSNSTGKSPTKAVTAVSSTGNKLPMVPGPKGSLKAKISRKVIKTTSAFEKYLVYLNIFLSLGIFLTLLGIALMVMVVKYDFPLEQLTEDAVRQFNEFSAVCARHSPVSKEQMARGLQECLLVIRTQYQKVIAAVNAKR